MTSVTSFVNPYFVTKCIKIHLSKAQKIDKTPLVPPLYSLLGTHIIVAENRPSTPF